LHVPSYLPFPKATIPPIERKKKTLFGAKERKGNCLQKSSSERLKKYHKDMLTMKS
jgi:hypothetical protein